MQEAYRLFRISKDNKPQSLFHGTNGTRTLDLDVVLEANVKQVWNPGGKRNKSLGYISGWHVSTSLEGATAYLKKFKDPSSLQVCRVFVDNIQPKPRSRDGIFLARFMKIQSTDWLA